MLAFKDGTMDTEDVHRHVIKLFNEEPDLQVDFKTFLPETAPTASSVETQANANVPTSGSPAEQEFKRPTFEASTKEEAGTPSLTARDLPLQSPWECGACGTWNDHTAEMRCSACANKHCTSETASETSQTSQQEVAATNVTDARTGDSKPTIDPVDERASQFTPTNEATEELGFEQVRKYGRYGDLKPENILWYKNIADDSLVDQSGTLKLSDLAHSHSTYSDIPEINTASGFPAETEDAKAQSELLKLADGLEQAQDLPVFVEGDEEQDPVVDAEAELRDRLGLALKYHEQIGLTPNNQTPASPVETHGHVSAQRESVSENSRLEPPPTYAKISTLR